MIALRTAARSVRRRPKQAFLIGVAIVAATAFAAASLLLATNARGALVAFGMSTPAAADAVIVPRGEVEPSVVAEIADRVRSMPRVEHVAVEYIGDVEVQTGGVTSTWKLTSDPGSGPLSAVSELHSGAAPEVGEVVLGPNTAERAGLTIGDTLLAGGLQLTVAAIGPVNEFGQDVALIREQDAIALRDAMMPVQIFVTGDVDVDTLGPVAAGGVVMSGDERRAQEQRSVTDTLVGVIGALSVFVGLAVLAAVVIVASTFRILLARRAEELALLRCVGASRSQVSRSLLIEAAFIGLLGGIAGVALGLGFAAVLVTGARAAGLLSAPFVSAPGGLAACVILAVASAVVAALPAARAAGRTPPVTALGAARSSEARAARLWVRLAVASALSLSAVAAGAAGLTVSGTDEFLGLALAALSGVLLFVALVAVGPFLVRASASLARPLVSGSVAMRLAVSNAIRASRRTAAMTTVLMLGVGMTAALIVGVAGATADARDGVARNFPSAAIIPVDLVADPHAVVDRLVKDPAVDARIDGADILIDPTPGASLSNLRTAVLDSTDASTPVYWAADVQEGIEQMILMGQIIGAAMIGVTMIVALIGVMVTLTLSVTERRQEIALLRALGVSRSGARRSIAAEAALTALVGAVTGVVFGTGYGLLALNVLGMSGGLPPLGALAALVFGIVLAAVIAAGAPMRSAGRVQPAIGLDA